MPTRAVVSKWDKTSTVKAGDTPMSARQTARGRALLGLAISLIQGAVSNIETESRATVGYHIEATTAPA